MDGPGLQRASVTQSLGLDKLCIFPDPRNGAAVFNRRDIVRHVMEHQRGDIDAGRQTLISDRFQHAALKVFEKQADAL